LSFRRKYRKCRFGTAITSRIYISNTPEDLHPEITSNWQFLEYHNN
jgi:hypothetical protein